MNKIITFLFSLFCVCEGVALVKTVEYNGCFYEYDTKTEVAKCVKAPDENHVYPEDIVIADEISIDDKVYPVVEIWYDTFNSSKDIKTVRLGENVKIIRGCSFINSSIEEIIFNDDLFIIDASVFQKCKNLKEVVFPPNLNLINFFAFGGSGLKKLNLNSNFFIELLAFDLPECEEITFCDNYSRLTSDAIRCPKVTSLNFPGTIYLQERSMGFENLKTITLQKHIGEDVYKFATDSAMQVICPLEKFVNYNTVPPIIGEKMFPDEVFANCTLVVPDESIDAYRNAPGWCKFGSIKGIAGVDDVASDTPEVVTREYFNINGQKIDAPQKGSVSIERAIMTDGSVRVNKIRL